MRRLSPFIPPLLWMGAIFLFSTSGFGSEQTGSIVEAVVGFLFPGLSHAAVEVVHHAVRKAGHLAEFGLLALLFHRALVGYGVRGFGRAAAITLAVSVLYSATDEIHQAFVPNRTASALDVLIDGCGAALALAVLRLKNKKTHP